MIDKVHVVSLNRVSFVNVRILSERNGFSSFPPITPQLSREVTAYSKIEMHDRLEDSHTEHLREWACFLLKIGAKKMSQVMNVQYIHRLKFILDENPIIFDDYYCPLK